MLPVFLLTQEAWKRPLTRELFNGLHMDVFSNISFPPADIYFSRSFQEDELSLENVYVVHNNMIKGHDKKVERFKEYNLWDVGETSFPRCGEGK